MTAGGTPAALLNAAVLIVLSAIAFFVLPGRQGIVIPIGVLAGLVLAMLTFGREMPAGETIPAALGTVVGLVLVAYAIPWVIDRELRSTEVGGMRPGLLSMSAAVGALLWGVALRLLWNSRKLIR